MSDYCRGCRYSPAVKLGAGACPFNLLYWDFLDRNKDRLSRNPRMAMALKTLDGMDQSRRSQILSEAKAFLVTLK